MPSDWSRRQTLRIGGSALVPLLAGCTHARPPSSPESTTTTGSAETPTRSESPTPSETATPTRQSLDGAPFSELRVEPTPSKSPFRHHVRFLAQPTSEHPARVEVSVRNASSTEQAIKTNHWELPFPSPLAKSGPETGLVLAQGGDVSRSDDCWRGYAKSYPMVDERTLAPGETLAKEYEVANWENNATCWPAGEYAFSQRYAVDPETDDYRYGWGFTLRI